MSDDGDWTPHRPVAERQPKLGEVLWDARKGHRIAPRRPPRSREDRVRTTDVREREFVSGKRYETRGIALAEAEARTRCARGRGVQVKPCEWAR